MQERNEAERRDIWSCLNVATWRRERSDRAIRPSVGHLEYLTKISPRSCQDLPRYCTFWEDLRRNPRSSWISCQDLDFILEILTGFCQDIQYEIQDLTKKSNIDSNNIFVEHVVLLQATLPEIEQRLYSEVEALC